MEVDDAQEIAEQTEVQSRRAGRDRRPRRSATGTRLAVAILEQKRHGSRVSIILTTLLRIVVACALDFPNRLLTRANHILAPYVLNEAASSTILEIPPWRHEFGRSS
jgi:hypothetical protein